MMRSIVIMLTLMVPILTLIHMGFSQVNLEPDITFVGDSPFDYYGHTIATEGDLNGDERDDIAIVRFSSSSNGLPDTGKVVIFFGCSFEAEVPTEIHDAEIVGEQDQDLFGFTVVSMGDANADGIDDLLVTAPGYDSYMGKAYIFFGGSWESDLTSDQADVIITLGELELSNLLGESGTLKGDYNGDGVPDLVISANYGNDVGQVFLFWGPLEVGVLPADSADIRIIGESQDDLFGFSPGTGRSVVSGDVNGDGQDDLIVGACGYDGTGMNIGRVYIFYGDQLTLGLTPQDANVIITGRDTEFSNDFSFGSSILTGDVDADGKDDILVGEFGYDLYPEFIGSFFLFLGNSLINSMHAEDADWTVAGTESQQFYTGRWSALGDIDENGYSDMIIASRLTNAVYIFTNPVLGEKQTINDANIILAYNNQTDKIITSPFAGNIVGSSKAELLVVTQRTSLGDTIGIVYVYEDINTLVRGDVNNDGSVNILDVIRSINIILGIGVGPSEVENWAADCNGNGVVNILDVLGIVNVILGIGECRP